MTSHWIKAQYCPCCPDALHVTRNSCARQGNLEVGIRKEGGKGGSECPVEAAARQCACLQPTLKPGSLDPGKPNPAPDCLGAGPPFPGTGAQEEAPDQMPQSPASRRPFRATARRPVSKGAAGLPARKAARAPSRGSRPSNRRADAGPPPSARLPEERRWRRRRAAPGRAKVAGAASPICPAPSRGAAGDARLTLGAFGQLSLLLLRWRGGGGGGEEQEEQRAAPERSASHLR